MQLASQAAWPSALARFAGTPPCSRRATRYASEPHGGRGAGLRLTRRQAAEVLGDQGGGGAGVHPVDATLAALGNFCSVQICSLCVYV